MDLTAYAALELLLVAGAVALAARAAWRQWRATQPTAATPKCRACGPSCTKQSVEAHAGLEPARKAL